MAALMPAEAVAHLRNPEHVCDGCGESEGTYIGHRSPIYDFICEECDDGGRQQWEDLEEL